MPFPAPQIFSFLPGGIPSGPFTRQFNAVAEAIESPIRMHWDPALPQQAADLLRSVDARESPSFRIPSLWDDGLVGEVKRILDEVGSVQRETDDRVRLVNQALEKCPGILEEEGWKVFWDGALTISEVDLPGFLATHRQYLRASQFLLSMGNENLVGYPAPINTPKGFAAMAAFLKLAKWEESQDLLDQTSRDLQAAEREGNELLKVALTEVMQKASRWVNHPRVLDSSADVLPGLQSQGSFSTSLQAFRELASSRRGRSAYALIFEHPSFIWIESSQTDLEAKTHAKAYGKWIVPLPDLEETVRAATKLFPHFEKGRLACAKFLTASTQLGVHYLLVYSGDQDNERREILQAAADRSAFFVYDRDCHEANALGGVLQELVKQLDTAAIEAALAQRERSLERISKPAFGQAWGISDIQRQIMRAVLTMNDAADPADRANYLALTYFEKWKDTMAALLPLLFHPANASNLRLVMLMARMTLGN